MCLMLFFIGNQDKPITQPEEIKSVVNTVESDILSTKSVHIIDISTTKSSELSTTDSNNTCFKSRHLSSSTSFSTTNDKNNQPSMFSSTDCAIIRPTPKHPSVSQDVTMSSTESSRRMSVSKSTSALTTNDNDSRMTRSKSAVVVKQGKDYSPLIKPSEKRKLPQDAMTNQKKSKSGE
jgi:hypothetical protein